MVKKTYLLGLVSFLLIPVVMLLGSRLFISINPEFAAGHPDYARNYRWLNMAKNFAWWSTMLMCVALWFLTFFFLLKSKQRSYWWLPLAVLGPLGFDALGIAVLTVLRDNAPAPRDMYQQFIHRLNRVLRVMHELALLAAVWFIAYQTIIIKRDLQIAHEAAATGTSAAQILNQQNASSGMWAFSEGLQEMYLVLLLYLLWPICFNLASRLPKLYSSR